MEPAPAEGQVYFELRDADGALPCAMWRNDFDALGLAERSLADGAQVVVAGGPDYYPGSRTSSPAFSFHVTGLRVAGEGDLLAQLDRLRKRARRRGPVRAAEGAPPPRACRETIGVVTAEGGKARDDVLAGLHRRGWAGRLVWAFAPVQDRHAAPRITRVLQDLAATGEVDVIIVARGGGSLADLFCFCDETLCRTVALLPVPVIASVGHHTDRTLLDDVAAVSCSTPTHAAEAAVGCHVGEARAALARDVARLQRHGRRAVVERARTLAQLSRAPARAASRTRARAAAPAAARDPRRRPPPRRRSSARTTARRALVLARKATATRAAAAKRRARARPAAARARRARPAAHARARLRARRGPRRRAARHVGAGRARRRATCGCASATATRMPRSGRTDGDARPTPPRTRRRPTRIEEIIRRLDSGEAGLRETLDLCKEGRTLVEFCANELDAVGKGLEELRLDELVARLEP